MADFVHCALCTILHEILKWGMAEDGSFMRQLETKQNKASSVPHSGRPPRQSEVRRIFFGDLTFLILT